MADMLMEYSLSHDGKSLTAIISDSSRWSAGQPFEGSLAIFSLATRRWTAYLHVRALKGVTTLSYDGSRLAFPASDGLHVYNTITHSDRTIGPVSEDIWAPEWSPDGRYIVYESSLPHDHNNGHRESELRIVDVNTGENRFLVAHGRSPSWSPSGEWIAYTDDSYEPGAKRCSIIRPDGRDVTVISEAPHGRLFLVSGSFVGSPVWSPDSSKLLLNVYCDWQTPFKTNVYEVDLKGKKRKLVKKNAGPVWLWVRLDPR